jgi:hypothetical protein
VNVLRMARQSGVKLTPWQWLRLAWTQIRVWVLMLRTERIISATRRGVRAAHGEVPRDPRDGPGQG